MKSVWWRMYKNKHRNLGKCQITTGRIIFSWKKLGSWNIQILCTTLLCDFFNGTCDGYFQAKNSQLINKKAETRFIHKIIWYRKQYVRFEIMTTLFFILAPSRCMDISFLLISQIFYLNWYIESKKKNE